MALDNPDLIVACVVGDGEAETGPLATVVALEQVHQPDPRRRGAADPQSERLQDREPDDPRAHQPRGARGAVRRLRLHAVLRRRRRSGADAPDRWRRRSSSAIAEIRAAAAQAARRERRRPAALADDRAAVAEGMDRAEGGQRPQGRKARGARTRCRSPTCATIRRSLKLLEEWMRSYKPEELFDDAAARCGRSCKALAPEGPPADERQPARQRRAAAQGAQAARLPRLRRRRCQRAARRSTRTPSRSASSCAT